MRTYLSLLLSFFLCISLFGENINKKNDLTTEEQIKFDYFFLESLRLKQKGEITNAYNALQYALQIDTTSAAALCEVSNYYFEMKDIEMGVQAMKKAVKYSPDNADYKLALANLYQQTDQISDAILIYEELVKTDPQNLELYANLSELYLFTSNENPENKAKAIIALNGIENNIGINEFVSLQKYQLYRILGDKEKAVEEVQKLIDKFPGEAKYLILLGDFYISENKKDIALSFYDKAKKADPDNPYYFISMANYYEMEGKDNEAVIQIENALKKPSLDMDTKLSILSRYIQDLQKNKKRMENADSLFKTLIELHPQEKELSLLYGQFLLLQGKIEDAKFQFRIITETDPEEVSAWTILLQIYIQENNIDEIIALCDRALVLFPNIPEFYFYQATAYMQKKENQIALDTYEKGLKHISEDNKALQSTFYGQIADIYFYLDNKKEAYINYEKSIQLNPANVNALNNYAYHLAINKEDLSKAERLSATAVQLRPESSTYLDTYAWVFFQKGNYSLAKFYIESALSKENNPGKVLIEHYGDILYKTGDIDKAIEQWKKALETEDNFEEQIQEDILKRKIKDKTYYEQ